MTAAISNYKFDPYDESQEGLPRGGIATFDVGGDTRHFPAIEQRREADGSLLVSVIQRPNDILPGSAGAHVHVFPDHKGEFRPRRTRADVRAIFTELATGA